MRWSWIRAPFIRGCSERREMTKHRSTFPGFDLRRPPLDRAQISVCCFPPRDAPSHRSVRQTDPPNADEIPTARGFWITKTMQLMATLNFAVKLKSDLMKIAMTTLSSKILSQNKVYFAQLAVDAVMRLKGSTNLEAIQIIKKPGGSLSDSFLDEGFILDKKIGLGQPKRIENAKILVANTAMDNDKVKIYGARVRVDSMSKVAEIEGAEKEKMREKVQKIIAHGINCFVNRQLIYNFPEELFADAGVLAIEHVDFEGIERLALVTGDEIASTFDTLTVLCWMKLKGLCMMPCVLSQTVNDTRVVLGGGWPEMVMAKAVDELARQTPGKKSHAIEAFSRALISIPTIIANNAGLDSADLVAQLRAEHHKEGCNAGIDVITRYSLSLAGVHRITYVLSVGDMAELGISESFKVKQAVLLSVTEAAEMNLRVDEIITCAPRKREDRM
ncbi:T-complex protein 1 subunit beta [Hibiscus syriacus]|uniref:T-complex protein 1 subunit beta n=1 Tax=Hibiscus syriacus TaxID=106335 RepID=A0A6A3B4A4_HIBSY|nr:T-complex protein 1 subunit beta [Hibiscus syriacus]